MPIPSPTPKLIPAVNIVWPKLAEAIDAIPTDVWKIFLGALVMFLARKGWDMVVDRQKQTIRAMILELFNQFTEKNNEQLRKAFIESQRLASENMIEVVKLERITEQSVERLKDFTPQIGKIINTLEDHNKRLLKLEVRRGM